jgi:hypothetical protein
VRALLAAVPAVFFVHVGLACGGGERSDVAPPDLDDAATAAADASRAPRPVRDGGLPDANDLEAGSCEDPGDPVVAPVLDGPLPVFSSTYGPTSRSSAHGANPNPAGTKCIVCHNPGGQGRAFFVAGTVNRTKPGATVPPMQVLVREAFGRVLAAQVDQDGNFFVELSRVPTCASLPLRAAVRTASASRAMPDPQRAGNCNGCHAGVTPP